MSTAASVEKKTKKSAKKTKTEVKMESVEEPAIEESTTDQLLMKNHQ